MSIILAILFVGFFGYFVWLYRGSKQAEMEWVQLKSNEFKRRIKLEQESDRVTNERLRAAGDDPKQRLLIELEAQRQRHQRYIHYTIQDMFERYQ